jgi:hypothetical protein
MYIYIYVYVYGKMVQRWVCDLGSRNSTDRGVERRKRVSTREDSQLRIKNEGPSEVEENNFEGQAEYRGGETIGLAVIPIRPKACICYSQAV